MNAMKAVSIETAEGVRSLCFVVPHDFDTQAWAESRRGTFRILNIVRVVEEIVANA
jgi:hypothetical protein